MSEVRVYPVGEEIMELQEDREQVEEKENLACPVYPVNEEEMAGQAQKASKEMRDLMVYLEYQEGVGLLR